MSSLIHSSHPILVFVFVLLMLMSFASWYVIIYKGLKLFGEYKAFNKFKAENLNIKDWPIKRNFKNSYGSVKLLIDESKDIKLLNDIHDSFEININHLEKLVQKWI